MEIKPPVSLKTIFLQFLGVLVLCLFTAAAIPYLLLTFSVNSGIAIYANNSELLAHHAIHPLTAAATVTKDLIPQGSSYVLLDRNHTVLQTDMSDADVEGALRFIRGEIENLNMSYRFLLITRDTEYVVLKYAIGSQFTNPEWNRVLPSPETILLVLFVLNILLACMISTTLFARRLRKQIEPLHEAAKQIGGQNLDFEVNGSGIQEFQQVITSFCHMKNNLKTALTKQWETEQRQREQIAALTHDLKTPLTSVIGNADLLRETKLDTEQSGYVAALLQSAESIEKAIGRLMEVSRAAGGYELNMNPVNVADFLSVVEKQAKPLANLKNIRLEIRKAAALSEACFDMILMEHALMNIVSNAIDFTPHDGTITVLAAEPCHGEISICVTDTGDGFSPEALQKATQQYYMGDGSRTGTTHHGMGLFIANSIVRQHEGSLTLANADPPPGAAVTITLPIGQSA